MRIINKREPFENWCLRVECNGLNWKQHGKIPCGSTLEINANDLLKRKWFKYPDNSGVNYGFVCPVCKCFTEVDESKINEYLKEGAMDYDSYIEGR